MTNTSHATGLAAGVKMTDAECIAFYNGIVAALPLGHCIAYIHHVDDAQNARNRLGHALDRLFDAGKTAYVGIDGAAVITPIHTKEISK